MTEQELSNWGLQESILREEEMAAMNSEGDLKRIQAAAAARRKAIGLTASQATWWVTVGQRLRRGEGLPFALRKR